MQSILRGATFVVMGVAAAGAASAADLSRPSRHRAHERVAYLPRGPMPLAVAVPRYRVVYQVPSNECARTNFCIDDD